MSGSSAAVAGAERYNRLVHQLYLAFLGRPPDPASLAQFADSLNKLGAPTNVQALVNNYTKNAQLRALIDSLVNSAESKAMYNGNSSQFITTLYRTLLGRDPDTAGKNFWVKVADRGALSRTVIALSLMNSAVAGTDAAALNNKVEASVQFTTGVEKKALSTSYTGTEATASARTMLGGITASTTPLTLATTVTSTINTLTPRRTMGLADIPADALTTVRLENTTSKAQSNLPVTFGQVFIAGQLAATDGLNGRLSDGKTIPLQVDVKATHADGSVRHAIISAIVPALAAAEIKQMDLIRKAPDRVAPSTAAAPANLNSRIELTLDGVVYTADLGAAAAGNGMKWLSGPIATETLYSAPFKTASGTAHPHLSARFDVRRYQTLNNAVRVDVVVENARTFVPGARNYKYDVKIMLGERVAYSQTALTHYHHARWHQQLWADGSAASPVHVMHNTGYLIATKAVPNYDQSIVVNPNTLAEYASSLTPSLVGPMKIGQIKPYMLGTGGRPDIGPLPAWAVSYLLSMDQRARASMMALADGSGSWSIHYRDENTGYPIRLDNEVNKNISTHMNLGLRGPLPVPRCASNDWSLCATPYTHDVAHQPSFTYLPYLLTGDYYYLEELQFWAATNPTETDPGGHGYGQGLVRWQQVRGQAWSLRTMGHVAYITPDTHYLKAYFNKMLSNNLDWYHNAYVVGNPNELGAYDGSGQGAFQWTGSAPWQDDFLTWSFGYLAELGFTKAEPILKWKAKYSVGRLTAPGYCWIEGSAYGLSYRDSPTSPIYKTFAELYAANFRDNMIKDDNGKLITHPNGLLYRDQPCGSQEQADWRRAASGHYWIKSQMVGYSSFEMGFPANMQIAVAVAANSGIPNATTAWQIFNSRANKPDYSKGPQFALVPR